MRMKITLTTALLHTPRLLVLDEPMWFAARYLPQPVQVPVVAAFIVVGALALYGPPGSSARTPERHDAT
jgi:hypothetical protein